MAGQSTTYEVQRRVDEIVTLLIERKRRAEIINYANRKEWNVADSTVDHYMQRARAVLAKMAKKDRTAAIGEADATYDHIVRRSFAEGDLKTALAAQKEKCVLRGLNAPTKNEVSGPAGGPIQLSNLSDEEVEKRALAILAKRQ
jgi:hypothetical protein